MLPGTHFLWWRAVLLSYFPYSLYICAVQNWHRFKIHLQRNLLSGFEHETYIRNNTVFPPKLCLLYLYHIHLEKFFIYQTGTKVDLPCFIFESVAWCNFFSLRQNIHMNKHHEIKRISLLLSWHSIMNFGPVWTNSAVHAIFIPNYHPWITSTFFSPRLFVFRFHYRICLSAIVQRIAMLIKIFQLKARLSNSTLQISLIGGSLHIKEEKFEILKINMKYVPFFE
jgi:hypothetical protein